MKKLAFLLFGVVLSMSLGCQPEVGSQNPNKENNTTENYDDPNYVPSYEEKK